MSTHAADVGTFHEDNLGDLSALTALLDGLDADGGDVELEPSGDAADAAVEPGIEPDDVE